MNMKTLSGQPKVMLGVTQFFSGFSGAVGTLFLLMAVNTNYWQLAAESCDLGMTIQLKEDSPQAWLYGGRARFYHEGLFWRCVFKGRVEEESFWIFLIGGKSTSKKICTHTYLFPTPIPDATIGAASESAEVYRTLWMGLMLLGIVMAMLAGFLSIGANSSGRASLYKAGGALFLIGGLLLLCALVMHVVWFHGLDTLEEYVGQQRATLCPSFHLSVRYGPSFMMAPVGAFFCLLCGSLHLTLARACKKGLIPRDECQGRHKLTCV